jgi:RND family efflux transporter MFP subunit
LGVFLNQLINSKLDQVSSQQQSQTANQEKPILEAQATPSDNTSAASGTAAGQTSATATPGTAAAGQSSATNNTSAPVEVTTIKLSEGQTSFVNAIGTVKSQNTVALFPQASASVKKVNFQEGDYVKTGDILVELTGSNLTDHPTQKQLKIAQTTYDNAKASLDNLVKTNNESLKTAELQVQSALSQASAIPYDLGVIEQNQNGLEDSLNILQNSLNQTRQKNARDLQKARNDIDDLIQNLNQAQDGRIQTISQINDLQNQLNNLPVQVSSGGQTGTPTGTDQRTALQTQLSKLQDALKTQDKAVEDLYTALDKARYGYSTTVNAAQLSENQLQGQIASSSSQIKTLDLNLESTKTKLGYTGDSSDALKIAEQTFSATRAQLQSAIDNAKNQLKLAELNLELAKDQASALQVKAPFNGVITSLNLSAGQAVNPQTSIAELINPQEFQLELNVDPSLADQISSNTPAQIQLGNKWLEVPVKSVAPKVDDKTKLVKVVLKMPNIFFRANQSVSAKLPLSPNATAPAGTMVLPLDAVTIATESQFVYVNDNGHAKRLEIKTGAIHGDQIEVLSGLNASDEVILEGAKNLTDGQAISVKNN